MENHVHFKVLLGVTIVTLGIGMLIFNTVEGWSLFDSFYFSVITLTTVGYGDIHPVTTLGKTLAMLYIFMGIGIIFGFVNAIAKTRFEITIKDRLGKYVHHRTKKK